MEAADWSGYANTVSGNLQAALDAALQRSSPAAVMEPAGADVAAGVGVGMAGYNFSSDAAALAANVKAAAAGSLNASTLVSAGISLMAGLAAGIRAGRSGVASALRQAAQDAVNAAKAELKIASPSGVFRDEIGRMAIKGLGEGVRLESKAQAKAIRNAVRFLTGEARAGSARGVANDNRRTYNQNSSVSVNVDSLNIRDRQDVQGLAVEIAHLVKRQLMGSGVRV
jgi:hypothetical protein